MLQERYYACIDLKSFFASVETVERGLDPFKTNLVVADETRGKGGICLAITPAMKNLGIKNRCRIYEIPDDVEYIIAKPRMKKYMEYSSKIYSIYLKYISPEDIHVYSIDECFIDITPYLNMYNKSPKQMANMLMNAVFDETGIRATAGVGTNMFLAKVALDITAKHSEDFIGYLNEEIYKKEIWRHRPITDIWGIGYGISKRLEFYGVFDMYGITRMREEVLYNEFGVNAELLIDHAQGIEPVTIKDIKNSKAKTRSISSGQILFKDYKYENVFLIVKEMLDNLVLELIEKNMMTNSISLFIGYSKGSHKTTGGTHKITNYTDSYEKLVKEFEILFKEKTEKEYPIRKITLGLNNLIYKDLISPQLNLFDDTALTDKERNARKAIINIKNKYGKNALLRGMSLEEGATQKIRNKLIGGHCGE